MRKVMMVLALVTMVMAGCQTRSNPWLGTETPTAQGINVILNNGPLPHGMVDDTENVASGTEATAAAPGKSADQAKLDTGDESPIPAKLTAGGATYTMNAVVWADAGSEVKAASEMVSEVSQRIDAAVEAVLTATANLTQTTKVLSELTDALKASLVPAPEPAAE